MNRQDCKTAEEMRLWNVDGNKPAFTKEEHSKGKGFDFYEMLWWNDLCLCQDPYTRDEIKKQEEKEKNNE